MFRIIQEMIDGTGNVLKELGVYMAGKGIVMTSALIAGFLFQGASLGVLAGIVGAGLVVSGFMRFRDMRHNLDRMADVYRGEIAQQLGIAPEEVTRQHVHTLAYGDTKRGIAPNPIMREEIDREWGKTWLEFGTTLAAAAVTFGLVSVGAAQWVQGASSGMSWLVGSGVGLVSAISGLIVNNGLDITIQSITPLGRYTMHDRINKLHRDITRGKTVTKEDVFALYVAADARLDQAITKHFGKSYDFLPAKQKAQAVEVLGATADMQLIANALNAKTISAGTVAFILSGQRNVGSEPKPAAAFAEEQQDVAPEKTRQSFVERVSQRPQPHMSNVEREEARRASAQIAEAAR